MTYLPASKEALFELAQKELGEIFVGVRHATTDGEIAMDMIQPDDILCFTTEEDEKLFL